MKRSQKESQGQSQGQSQRRSHQIPFGAHLSADDRTRFRLWAPSARRIDLKLQSGNEPQLLELQAVEGGWYEGSFAVPAGTRYSFRIDDELDVPDPASRFNPDGVHGASEVIDPRAFEWRNDDWEGHDWHELVIYELHVGTFTREGTYAAAAERLADLASLGVTCIELLPLAAFGGQRGWGYDGVLPYAPHAAYGTPEDLKHFVQSAHDVGLSVLIDVVYNHFGPDGNYLSRYAAPFFTSRHHTPWGDAIDFGKREVREFFIQNALYWIAEYHFDGLRIDAVHAMYDDGPRHLIDELVDRVQDLSQGRRAVHIVLENHHNEARRLRRAGVSQWNDDYHHALHVLMTGETEGYYRDYAERPLWQLGRALAHGFVYQGERSLVSGEARGEPSGQLPLSTFVNFLQNHDQIGNRAFGDRLAVLAESQTLHAGFTLLLLAPQLPMLFMGEEYAARQPFFYFCDYQGELAQAVREGRRAEFEGFAAFSDPRVREKIPDPNAQATFEQSRLDWSERASQAHRSWWELTRALLRLRAEVIVPLIPRLQPERSGFNVENDVLSVRWSDEHGIALQVIANLSDQAKRIDRLPAGRHINASLSKEQGPAANSLEAWDVRFFVRD